LPPKSKSAPRSTSVVVVGSSNTDMVVRLPRIPRPGETLLGGEFFTAPGGKGGNQAVSAARCGGRVTFIARVGRDALGDQAVAGYRRDGIDTRYVSRDTRAPSGVALIFVAGEGENCIAVAGGANARLGAAEIQKAAATIRSAAVLVVQLETPLPTVRAAVRLAASAGVPVILNPAPARELPDSLLHMVTYLTPNETEAELLTGIRVRDDRSAAAACANLHARGVITVIITLGSRGAFVSAATGGTRVPGFKVKALDTTGAGDVFNGALAVAIAEGQALSDAARFANAAAALSVMTVGAQTSAPARAAIGRLLRKR
jgi:ribokinase